MKLPIIISIMFLLIMGTVGALEPCPIAAKFITFPPSYSVGLTVELQYGDRSWIGTTNEYGEFLIDLGSEGIYDCNIQTFNLIIKDCEDNELCHQTISFNPQGYTTIDISEIDLTRKCPECMECMECMECSICPEDITPFEKCDSCCEIIECEKCTDFSFRELIIGIISAIAVMGGGLKIYKMKSGEVATQHKHTGITAYHDVNTRHKDKKYRHRLLKDDPIGFVEDVKKINEGGL